MLTQQTSYGAFHIGDRDALYRKMAEAIQEASGTAESFSLIALTGGSTPKAFYRWCVAQGVFDSDQLNAALWTTSDERHVPRDSEESNFGTAERLFLDPMGVREENRIPWPVDVDPHSAGIVFNRLWAERFGEHRGFDLCFLGMGEDGHTASLFPGSPLIGLETEDNFSCVEVPGKGWRLTINETGISRCSRICVIVTGAGKADAVHDVLHSEPEDSHRPIQLLRRYAERVVWLVDEEAAGRL